MVPSDITSDYPKDYWFYRLFLPYATPQYPEDYWLYRLFFGLNEEKTRAELGRMLEIVGLDRHGQIIAPDIENQNEQVQVPDNEQVQVPDIEYFNINSHGKEIDLAKIRAGSVYWVPEWALAILDTYLVLQNNYGIAKTTRVYYTFFFDSVNKPSWTKPAVRASVGVLLPGTGVTVLASKALKVINLPREIRSWGQETLLRVIKESFSKINGYELCLIEDIDKNGRPEPYKLYLTIDENKQIRYRTSLTPGSASIKLEGDIAQEDGDLYQAIQEKKLAKLDELVKKKLLDKTSSKHHTHVDTLLIALEREEYRQEIKDGIDSKYGFIYTAYMEAKQNNVRLVFAIGNDLTLSLLQIVEAVAKQSEFEEFGESIRFSVLPFSENYHEHELSTNHNRLICDYHPRRMWSYFSPTIQYGKLIYAGAFFLYIMFFNYLLTYIVSICQAYITLAGMLGVDENSSLQTQVRTLLGAVFIGVIRNWVTIGQKEDEAEKALHAFFSSFCTFIKTYVFNPSRIVHDPLAGLATMPETFHELRPRSRQERQIRWQQLYYILVGIFAELATHFTYASNTLFFFGDTVTVWSKLLLGMQFSPQALLISSLLAAIAQVSLNSTSQGKVVREKYFAKARKLGKKISRMRRDTTPDIENSLPRSETEETFNTENQLPHPPAEQELCATICAYVCAYTAWMLLLPYNFLLACYDFFFAPEHKERKWSGFWWKIFEFWLNRFVSADAINTALTASTGVINVLALYAAGLPTWQVILISLCEFLCMYFSQTTFSTENIEKDMLVYEKLFHCHRDNEGILRPCDKQSGRYSYITYVLTSTTSFFGCIDKKSRGSDEGIDMTHFVSHPENQAQKNPMYLEQISDDSDNSNNSSSDSINSPSYRGPSPYGGSVIR